MSVSVSASLVMLATEVNPDVRGDTASAKLVAAKDVGDGLAGLRARVTVVDIHALDILLNGTETGGGGGRGGFHGVARAAIALLRRGRRRLEGV